MSYDQRYPRVYGALKRNGFSASKALEIIIDATRRNDYALKVCRIVARIK